MKRRIILFLLNLIGGKKNQSTEEETHAKRAGCGCLLAIAFAPFLPILIFIILIVWISSSLMSCAAPVVLSEVFGVEITADDEKMLRAGLAGGNVSDDATSNERKVRLKSENQ